MGDVKGGRVLEDPPAGDQAPREPPARPRCQQLDRAHHLVVRDRADRDLEQEPVVLEDLVPEEDLVEYGGTRPSPPTRA